MDRDDQRLAEAIRFHLDGTLSAEEALWLDAQIVEDPGIADRLVEQARLEQVFESIFSRERIERQSRQVLESIAASLESDPILAAEFASEKLTAESTRRQRRTVRSWGLPAAPSRWRRWGVGAAVAASLFLAVAAVYMTWADGGGDTVVAVRPAARIAEVTSSLDALWLDGAGPDSLGWLPHGPAHLLRGQAELKFASGAIVVLQGPAEFQAISPTAARLREGKMTARVDGLEGVFRIETPAAEVIDLGTEFGLSVGDNGATDVAVFDGMVDITPRGDDGTPGATERVDAAPERRLGAGQGLSVDLQGQFHRLVTVSEESFPLFKPGWRLTPAPTPRLLVNVSDNLDDGEADKFYRIVSEGIYEDSRAYVDREFEWNSIGKAGIPEVLREALYIMPFNDDKAVERLSVKINVSQPATLFVLFDDRGETPPWLLEGFSDTGLDIGMDEGPDSGHPEVQRGVGAGVSIDQVFSVWQRDVPQPGRVNLGPRLGKGSRSMYGMAIVPLPKERAER